MTPSDATDHRHRPLDRSWSPTRWPLPPLIAATTALAASAIVLALATPTGRGTTDQAAAVAASRLTPGQARRSAAQAAADRFAATFARALSRPITRRELQAAGASPTLARRIAGSPRPDGGTRRRPRTGAEPPRTVDVAVHAEREGWLATATVLTGHARQHDSDAQRLPLTFRLERRPGHPHALVVVDANDGGHGE